MTAKTCYNCGSLFEGRANKVFCSSRCKSATNNERVAERDKNARFRERKLRANRRIVTHLYSLFGKNEIPSSVIENSGIDMDFSNGISPNALDMQFLDYVLTQTKSHNFLILKEEENAHSNSQF